MAVKGRVENEFIKTSVYRMLAIPPKVGGTRETKSTT